MVYPPVLGWSFCLPAKIASTLGASIIYTSIALIFTVTPLRRACVWRTGLATITPYTLGDWFRILQKASLRQQFLTSKTWKACGYSPFRIICGRCPYLFVLALDPSMGRRSNHEASQAFWVCVINLGLECILIIIRDPLIAIPDYLFDRSGLFESHFPSTRNDPFDFSKRKWTSLAPPLNGHPAVLQEGWVNVKPI